MSALLDFWCRTRRRHCCGQAIIPTTRPSTSSTRNTNDIAMVEEAFLCRFAATALRPEPHGTPAGAWSLLAPPAGAWSLWVAQRLAYLHQFDKFASIGKALLGSKSKHAANVTEKRAHLSNSIHLDLALHCMQFHFLIDTGSRPSCLLAVNTKRPFQILEHRAF